MKKQRFKSYQIGELNEGDIFTIPSKKPVYKVTAIIRDKFSPERVLKVQYENTAKVTGVRGTKEADFVVYYLREGEK